MDELIIRKAIRSDQSEILKLVRSENLNPMKIKWKNFIVAESKEDGIKAIGQLKEHRDGSIELASLVVKTEFRGQGLARKLIEILTEGCVEPVYLMCRSGLGDFYQRFGFNAISEEDMPRYFKRISKLFDRVKGIIGREESLLIMRLNPRGS